MNRGSVMALDLTYPHIEKQDGKPAHLKRIPRIRVAHIVMDYLAYGWSPDEMCRQHPYLQPAEVHAAMTYYFDHQDEIEREIHLEWQQVQHDRSRLARSPFYLPLKARGLL
jgi:uncharacterized protein (DUF433 family)